MKINYSKSEAITIGLEEVEGRRVAKLLNYKKKEHFPLYT